MAIKLARQLEAALVAYLIDQRDSEANAALAGVAILEGHRAATLNADGETPAEELNALIVTASRARRYLETGGNYEIAVQFRKDSQADDVSLAAHDAVVQEIEALFSPENEATVLAFLNAYDATAFQVNGFDMDDEGEAEARTGTRHGDALPYTFEAYYETP